MQTPHPDVEGFVALLLQRYSSSHTSAHALERGAAGHGLQRNSRAADRKAFGMWFMGQSSAMLAFICLMLVITILFPNAR